MFMKNLRIWLWISVAMALIGAFLLYPIGLTWANVVFILIKAGMVGGLLIYIFCQKNAGLILWMIYSIGAVIMTIIKIRLTGTVNFLFISSIVADIGMPLVAALLLRKVRGKNS